MRFDDFRKAWKKDRRFFGFGRDDREREKAFKAWLRELGEGASTPDRVMLTKSLTDLPSPSYRQAGGREEGRRRLPGPSEGSSGHQRRLKVARRTSDCRWLLQEILSADVLFSRSRLRSRRTPVTTRSARRRSARSCFRGSLLETSRQRQVSRKEPLQTSSPRIRQPARPERRRSGLRPACASAKSKSALSNARSAWTSSALGASWGARRPNASLARFWSIRCTSTT